MAREPWKDASIPFPTKSGASALLLTLIRHELFGLAEIRANQARQLEAIHHRRSDRRQNQTAAKEAAGGGLGSSRLPPRFQACESHYVGSTLTRRLGWGTEGRGSGGVLSRPVLVQPCNNRHDPPRSEPSSEGSANLVDQSFILDLNKKKFCFELWVVN